MTKIAVNQAESCDSQDIHAIVRVALIKSINQGAHASTLKKILGCAMSISWGAEQFRLVVARARWHLTRFPYFWLVSHGELNCATIDHDVLVVEPLTIR